MACAGWRLIPRGCTEQFDSVLCACRVEGASGLLPAARQMYMMNCLAAMAAALGGRGCCAGRSAALERAAEGHMARLVGGEAGSLLSRCGLAEIADRVRCAPSQTTPAPWHGSRSRPHSFPRCSKLHAFPSLAASTHDSYSC